LQAPRCGTQRASLLGMSTTSIIILLLVLLLVFGGGGLWYRGRRG